MSMLVTALFLILWLAIGFFALRLVAKYYFHEPRRADAAAAAVVLAFAIGAIWPFSARFTGSEEPNTSPPDTAVITAPATAGGSAIAMHVTVPAACRSKSRSFVSSGAGSLDALAMGASGPEVIANGGEISRQGHYSVVGWAVDHTLGGPAKGVCLVVDGELDPHAASSYGGARPDVVAAYHNDRLLRSSFNIPIQPGLLSPGNHVIQVVAISADGSLAIIGGRSVSVR